MATVKKIKKAQDGAKKFAALAPPYDKATFADKIAGAKKSAPKAQAGKTVMQKLKSKYPSADTTAKGDVRGSEMNAYGPKKAVKQYSDTYDAFDKKFNKGKSYRAGGKIKKAQAGLGLKPSKPAGPIDPNGAWTKVQERTIAGKKAAKVPLKKDKQLGATKMKGGGKMSKKK
tara:strand:- start:5769 stop:6284 length:516 start_codon:yes stop_codon:yes gene_type:complete